MLFQLLTSLIIISASLEAASPTPPIQKEVKSGLDGKLINLDGEWGVALSDNTIQMIRSDQIERFLALMAEWNNEIPPFIIYENFENFYPYSITFPGYGSFALIMQLAAKDLYVLTLGEPKLFILEAKEYPLVKVNGGDFWQVTNPDAHWDSQIEKWNIGDTIAIVPVIAESSQNKRLEGHLVFHFESASQAEEWLSGTGRDQISGYWIKSLY